jgi:hypothetical protein
VRATKREAEASQGAFGLAIPETGWGGWGGSGQGSSDPPDRATAVRSTAQHRLPVTGSRTFAKPHLAVPGQTRVEALHFLSAAIERECQVRLPYKAITAHCDAKGS